MSESGNLGQSAERELDLPDDNDFAESGTFGVTGREHAIRIAFPIVGRYYQKSGISNRLTSRPGIRLGGADAAADTRLIAGLRLRAALSTATQLLDHIERIAREPTFKYSLVSTVSIGHLSGSLDVPAYVSRMYWDGGPQTFPMLEARRSVVTAENIMASYAALWMASELDESMAQSGAPLHSPEAKLCSELRNRCIITGAMPALRPCRDEAIEVLRRQTEALLLDRVDSRIRRGEISRPEVYRLLHEVLVKVREGGPSGGSGDATWSFYDPSFDTRLFELWCLFVSARAVSEALVTELPPLDPSWEGSGIAFRWERPSGVLEMYSQKSPTSIDPFLKARWMREGSGKLIRGIPDIILRGKGFGATASHFAFWDAKLRELASPPTGELYKLLGYFDNFARSLEPQGVIFYHAPELHESEVAVFRPSNGTAEPGRLITTSLNPSDEAQTRAALLEVAEMALSLLDLPPPSTPSKESLANGEAAVARLREEMRSIFEHLPPQTLEASRRRVVASLGQRYWDCLPADAKDMLATAEHIGFTIDRESDFSGPVLSTFVPLEILINKHLIEPAMEGLSRSQQGKIGPSVGKQIGAVLEALDGKNEPHHQAINLYVDRRGLDVDRLRDTFSAIAGLNRDYRRRAAHTKKLHPADFEEVYCAIVTRNRQIVQLIDALRV